MKSPISIRVQVDTSRFWFFVDRAIIRFVLPKAYLGHLFFIKMNGTKGTQINYREWIEWTKKAETWKICLAYAIYIYKIAKLTPSIYYDYTNRATVVKWLLADLKLTILKKLK